MVNLLNQELFKTDPKKFPEQLKMSAEAEKVISLSLCKMAESRTIRRGGTSLHKHLLIASVLTKATRARSAILDTWYMGGDTAEGNVDLNMSYQEADFPSEELDSALRETSDLDIDPSIVEQVTSEMKENNSHNNKDATSTRSTGENPRFAADIESEIDLPPDILHCVEKLGDLNDRIFSSSQSGPLSSSSSVSTTTTTSTCPLYIASNGTGVIPDVVSSPQQFAIPQVTEDVNDDSHISNTLTYLDLDAGSPTVVERGPIATSTPTKRRRDWCFEEEDDEEICGDGGSRYVETPTKSESSEKSAITYVKSSKRLRFDDDDDSGISSPASKNESEVGVPSQLATVDGNTFKAGNFRLTYEDEDGEDSDDDSFLEDALSQGLQSPSQIQMVKTRHRNDRRVPSASSSGSCSDEDAEEGEGSMEVDQITNLVQFISFNKQQSQTQNAGNMRSISCVN